MRWMIVLVTYLAVFAPAAARAQSASTRGPAVPLGSGHLMTSTSGGPVLPPLAINPSHCVYEVPNRATVNRDGTITDASGQPTTATRVCSSADLIAPSSSLPTTASVALSTSSSSQAASISTATPQAILEAYQQAPFSYGWGQVSVAVNVPQTTSPSTSAEMDFFAGLFNNDTSPSTIYALLVADLEFQNGQWHAQPLWLTNFNQSVTGPSLPVNPGDVLMLSVSKVIGTFNWTAQVADTTQGTSRAITVQFDPAFPWALPGVMQGIGSGGSGPLDSCNELPSLPFVHFYSPQLVAMTGSQSESAQPFSPPVDDFSSTNGQPSCTWSSYEQGDNGNQAGILDFVWGCTPSYNCSGIQCAQVNFTCIPEHVTCSTCPSGTSCNTSTNQCVANCQPTTCALQGATCGSISDGCGGTLDCGSCNGTLAVCTSGHTCSCQRPYTCADLSASCGTMANGCGGTLQCGSCPQGKSCSASHQCTSSGGGTGGSAPVPAMPLAGVGALSALLLAGGTRFARKRKHAPKEQETP